MGFNKKKCILSSHNFSAKLKKLQIQFMIKRNSINYLPSSLKLLICNDVDKNPINLPQCLETLELTTNSTNKYVRFGKNLKYIKLDLQYKMKLNVKHKVHKLFVNTNKNIDMNISGVIRTLNILSKGYINIACNKFCICDIK